MLGRQTENLHSSIHGTRADFRLGPRLTKSSDARTDSTALGRRSTWKRVGYSVGEFKPESRALGEAKHLVSKPSQFMLREKGRRELKTYVSMGLGEKKRKKEKIESLSLTEFE